MEKLSTFRIALFIVVAFLLGSLVGLIGDADENVPGATPILQAQTPVADSAE